MGSGIIVGVRFWMASVMWVNRLWWVQPYVTHVLVLSAYSTVRVLGTIHILFLMCWHAGSAGLISMGSRSFLCLVSQSGCCSSK